MLVLGSHFEGLLPLARRGRGMAEGDRPGPPKVANVVETQQIIGSPTLVDNLATYEGKNFFELHNLCSNRN